ncbi:MAG TPA: hypothetical protein VIR57_05090 [Chloroflexota bacterium]|jgi:hypothetical protein
MDLADTLFFLCGLLAPLMAFIFVPRWRRKIIAGCLIFLYMLLAFSGFPFLLVLLLVGLLPAFIAFYKGRSFLIWWCYGAILPVVALPHAVHLRTELLPRAGPEEDYAAVTTTLRQLEDEPSDAAAGAPSRLNRQG